MIHDIICHYYQLDSINENIINMLYEKELTPAELYQILFKFISYEDLKHRIDTIGFESIFETIINREEEELLRKQCKMISKKGTGEIKTKKQVQNRNPPNRFIKKGRESSSESDE